MSSIAYFVAVTGHHVWATEGQNGIEIIDASNPAVPELVKHINMPGQAYSITFDDRYAYVAAGAAGALIFDLANPADPLLVASIETSRSTHALLPKGEYIYAATAYGIEVFKAMPALQFPGIQISEIHL